MKLGACVGLLTRSENQTWYRSIEPQHWPTALATGYSRRTQSRFSPATENVRGFRILYLAEDHEVALFEVGALLGSPVGLHVPNPHQAWVVLNVAVQLQAVADLTDAAAQRQLATTAQELTGDWRGYRSRTSLMSVSQPTGQAPTQALGAALHAVPGLEGFRTISAKIPTKMNLVIFPSKLRSGSSVSFHEPGTGKRFRIRAKAARRSA